MTQPDPESVVPSRDASEGHWLVREERVLATVEVARTRRERRNGLLGRAGIEGAMLFRPCRMVHTMGMNFAIDVAHLDGDGHVLRVTTMKPHRVGVFVARARSVLETEAGAFNRWGVAVGDRLEIR